MIDEEATVRSFGYLLLFTLFVTACNALAIIGHYYPFISNQQMVMLGDIANKLYPVFISIAIASMILQMVAMIKITMIIIKSRAIFFLLLLFLPIIHISSSILGFFLL